MVDRMSALDSRSVQHEECSPKIVFLVSAMMMMMFWFVTGIGAEAVNLQGRGDRGTTPELKRRMTSYLTDSRKRNLREFASTRTPGATVHGHSWQKLEQTPFKDGTMIQMRRDINT
jgi:hypothetical protein